MNGNQKGWELSGGDKGSPLKIAEMTLEGRKKVKMKAVLQAIQILLGSMRKSEKYHQGNPARWL